MIPLIPLLQTAGLLHLSFLAAGAMMPRATGIPEALRTLPPFPRRMFWMYYTFIGTCLAGFGAGSFLLAPELASGTALARAVCGFLALFWTVRLLFGTFVLDLKPFLTSRPKRIGYRLLNTAFSLLPPVYLLAAFTGGRA